MGRTKTRFVEFEQPKINEIIINDENFEVFEILLIIDFLFENKFFL